MVASSTYLSGEQERARWMRLDTAQILKRFFFCERALLLAEAAWLPLIHNLDVKIELPRFIWQSAQTAHALRERVFELRYPSRLMDENNDAALIQIYGFVKYAPSTTAMLQGVSNVLLPALRDAYQTYLTISDPIADGPTHRFLKLALSEKEEQITTFQAWLGESTEALPHEREAARLWTSALAAELDRVGGVGIDVEEPTSTFTPIPGSRAYATPEQPARDSRFRLCRFYWPDVVDATFPYGEGVSLQLRSAVSHLNEVWAVETGGIILSTFAEQLPWEWVNDAARWTYDESRHCRMGYNRLLNWGFTPANLPLGTYIYDSAAGQDPIYRLGLLFFFETKNIKNKPIRTKAFHSYGDSVSAHDMDFDWADETIHAGYGKHWLTQLLALRGEDPNSYDLIRERCGELVAATVNTAMPEEVIAIKQIAATLLEQAQQRITHE